MSARALDAGGPGSPVGHADPREILKRHVRALARLQFAADHPDIHEDPDLARRDLRPLLQR
jgi:hypothetical protein